MIAVYNPEAFGDCLVTILADSGDQEVKVDRIGNVAKVYTDEKVIGYNFFNVVQALPSIKGKSGQVFLEPEELDYLNAQLFDAGFDAKFTAEDAAHRIVIGYVRECVEHPDSDHLHITQTEVANGEVLQIVCGAPNIDAGQKVVVATPGSMMPDGSLIWDGVLRGVPSAGMICSAKELHLKDAPQERGILVLSENAKVGEPFFK